MRGRGYVFGWLVIVLAVCFARWAPGAVAEGSAPAVPVYVAESAAPVERTASQDLASYLQNLYPSNRFSVVERLPKRGDCIWVGSATADSALKKLIGEAAPGDPESFVVRVAEDGDRRIGVIAGADPRGTAYGAYALLEKLGFGFYLSYDTAPSARNTPFSFDDWEMEDAPLVRDRVVFNWHNFLSGCSTWNLPHWKKWIVQAQKMGCNGVMVHAYGNNPMATFSFKGKQKPVGYLSTTRKGRDWSTQHVNDVRRLFGGEVFDQPVFGADAAIVPDEERAASAQRLMHDVFACAKERAMDVYFAVDVDTASANPQQLITALPRADRFQIGVPAMRWMNQDAGGMWLARPDTPEGYKYYMAQVEEYLRVYPQIDCLVVWFRHNNTPWMSFKKEEMPESWQKEYEAEIAKTPEAAKLWRSVNFFALGKIVAAFRRAANELGRDDVEIAIGSWHFDFLPGCDRFLPRDVKFLPLDWNVLNDKSQLRDAESRRVIREAGAHRPVVPIVWAHHDDGNYVGRPYTPFSDFHSRLVDSNAVGFGIIHWTTRPLDLYFKSTVDQVWRSTQNQPVREACDEMALRLIGAKEQKPMSEYLYRWVTESPKIGRETSDWFIDRELGDLEEVTAGYCDRMNLLDPIDSAFLKPEARDRLNYFKGLEEYILDVHIAENGLRRALARVESGNRAGARQALAQCNPGLVIERYARFAQLGGITRGEEGLIVSMNLRWLTHYIRLRQSLGMEPIRINMAPTSHDPLAQSMGTFTFHFEPDHSVWECWGEKETGVPVKTIPADTPIELSAETPENWREMGRHYIESDKPITLSIQPIMARDGRGKTGPAPLAPGLYRLYVLTIDPTSSTPGERVMRVDVSYPFDFEVNTFKPVKAKYLRLLCWGNSANDWNSIYEVKIASLDRNAGKDVVTASGAVDGYPASHAIDGDPKTRWAAQGLDHWIQFRLNPEVAIDHVDITWYDADRRKAKYGILVSNDGKTWSNVDSPREVPSGLGGVASFDFKSSGKKNQLQVFQQPIVIPRTGHLSLTLVPARGNVILCGIVLEFLGE